MIDRDVILEKINSIQRCLATIQLATKGDTKALDDIIIQDAVVLNLQRAIQLCIDIASYLIANLKLGLPATLKEAFFLLRDNKIIDTDLAETMGNMVGFRNVAVHDYQKLNVGILKSIVEHKLGDFEKFYTVILNYLNSLEKS